MKVGMYWFSMKKFHTGENRGKLDRKGQPIEISDVLAKDVTRSSLDFHSFYAMGITESPTFDAGLASTSLRAFDSRGNLLIAGELSESGTLSSIRTLGNAGELRIADIFKPQRAHASLSALFSTGPILVEMLFDTVDALYSVDVYAQNGTISFYAPSNGEPPTEILEPASGLLTLLSVAAASRLRGKYRTRLTRRVSGTRMGAPPFSLVARCGCPHPFTDISSRGQWSAGALFSE